MEIAIKFEQYRSDAHVKFTRDEKQTEKDQIEELKKFLNNLKFNEENQVIGEE